MTTIVEVIKPNLTQVVEVNSYVSVPSGGTNGQVLAKASNTSYDMEWVDQGGSVSVAWGDVTGKPSTFPPSAHTHVIADVTGLQTALDGKYNIPTGDTTQYVAGDGSLIAFPVAGQAGTLVRQVRNETGTTLTKGTVVYITGASGNKATVSRALANSDATSAQTFGVVQADIPTNSNGYVVVRGDIAGIDTSAYVDGTQLYLSGSVAGTYTSTKPVAPIHMVYVGVVTRQHATQGQIEVAIQNGYEMDELHDVLIVSKTNRDVISYESASGLWKNKQLTSLDISGLDTQLSNKQPLATVLTNTTASFTTAQETKLSGVAAGATANSTDSQLRDRSTHTGTQLASTISDFNTAADARVVAGITGKENTITAGTTSQYWRGDKSWQTLDKTVVGLSNVDNTNDVNKPISTATQTALNSKYDASNPSGYTSNLGTVTTFNFTNANGFTGTVSTAGTTPTLSLTLQNATSGQSGQLTSTDWNTFNGKQAALSGTGFVKITGTTISYDNSTYLTSNQSITLSGDASGSGTTSITVTLGNNVVSNAKLAQVPTATFKGRITASTGNVEDLTASQATSLLDTFTSGSKGVVGASGGGTTNFLRADGTWAAPPSGGGGGNAVVVDVDFGSSFTDKAQVVVTGQSWVTATSSISCQVLCPTGSDPDELYLLNIKPVVSSLVDSTGFTLTLYSEQEAKGIYKVMCVGV
jgi:ribosomal protein L35AE/L33A